MKKNVLLFIILLIPVAIFAQKTYPATIYFKNGTLKQGNTEMAKSNTTTLSFKESEGFKSEAIKSDDIRKIEYYDEKAKDSISLLYAEFRKEKNGKKPKIQKRWITKIYSGKDISVYFENFGIPGKIGSHTSTSVQNYYFIYKNESPKLIFYTYYGGNLMGQKAYRQNISYYLKNFFGELCPDVIRAFDNGEIEVSNNPIPFAKYYESHCGKKY